MNQPPKKSGFTIVELLIVIVVIAILATVSFVSYIGAQSRARASKAKFNAAAVKSVAESYYSQQNSYPTSDAQFRSGLRTLPSDILLLTTGSLSANNGENTVVYKYVGSAGNATGACIYYWDFAPPTGSPGRSAIELLGTATTSNCSATAGNGPTP